MLSVHQSDLSFAVNQTLVIILAGGQGNRLHELTDSRAKPCLEFGASYKLIDFPLSNCINAGLKRIGVATQYKSHSLLRHLVNQSQHFNQNIGEFLDLLPASQQISSDWYQGTADALYQNIAFIKSVDPRYVLVLSGDHVYKMDYRNMLQQHVQRKSDMTVSCIEVPIEQARGQFGVMHVDNDERIVSFEEKPLFPEPLVDKPNCVLASMGNYIFNTKFLLDNLEHDAANVDSQHDFGKDIIPKLIAQSKLHAFRFRGENNTIPYWRDVGTLDNYWRANMDLLDTDPAIIMPESYWPISTAPQSLSPTQFTSDDSHGSLIKKSQIASGCQLDSCSIDHSLVFEQVSLRSGAKINDSMLLPHTTIGENCRINKAIVDAQTSVPANTVIGENKENDKRNGFRVTEQGVTLVTQKALDELLIRANKPKASNKKWEACVCAFPNNVIQSPTFSQLSKSISMPKRKAIE